MKMKQKLSVPKKVFIFLMCILGALISLFLLIPYFNLLPFNIYLPEYLLFTIFEFLAPILLVASFLLLILQVLKKKDKIYKWLLLILNTFFLIIIAISVLLILLTFIHDMEIRANMQFEAEHIELSEAYQPIFNYLEKYKNKVGIYPNKIDADSLKIESKDFKNYTYKTSKDNKTYTIKVFPRGAFIKYYQYDKDDTQHRNRDWHYLIR